MLYALESGTNCVAVERAYWKQCLPGICPPVSRPAVIVRRRQSNRADMRDQEVRVCGGKEHFSIEQLNEYNK